MLSVGQQQKKVLYSSSLLVQEGVSFCLEGIIFSQSIMPQLDNSHNSSGHAFSSLLSIFPPMCSPGQSAQQIYADFFTILCYPSSGSFIFDFIFLV